MTERSTNTKDISDLWLAMKRKHRRLSRGLGTSRLLRLSDSEVDIMWMMNLSDSLVVGDISKRLELPKSTVTGLVARLESRGYIERRINPQDLRTFSLFLTEQGKALVSEYDDFEKALFHRLMAPLTHKESRLFLKLLWSIVDDGGNLYE
ncbi:MAG: MarR family transcriptional regulator [Clostridiaceae bacterium]|nr:MarR family transcriptional regulator [Clostridiaceae bacterium]